MVVTAVMGSARSRQPAVAQAARRASATLGPTASRSATPTQTLSAQAAHARLTSASATAVASKRFARPLTVVAGNAASDQEVLVWTVGTANAARRLTACYASASSN